MARPTKRTPEAEQKICNALRIGATRKDAAESAGVEYETFRDWTKRFSSFSASVSRAEGEVAARMAARLYQEATKDTGDWKASLEWLKRRRREDWGDSAQIALTGAGGGPVRITEVVIEKPKPGDEGE